MFAPFIASAVVAGECTSGVGISRVRFIWNSLVYIGGKKAKGKYNWTHQYWILLSWSKRLYVKKIVILSCKRVRILFFIELTVTFSNSTAISKQEAETLKISNMASE